MNIGCHVSVAKGLQNAPQRAFELGCEAMQIFSRSPRGGKAPELTPEICNQFKIQNLKFKIKASYIHTPYYINFVSTNQRICYGSVKVVREELERGNLLGVKYVVTHLGSAKDMIHRQSIKKVIEMLGKTLENYSGKTKLILENSAGAGNIIGSSLADLKTILDGLKSKAVTGICLDTQHSFASGYDWNNFEKTLLQIDKELDLQNIKLFHINDSLVELGSKKDRHAHLGEGKIKLKSFEKITSFAQKNEIDLILETEHDKVKKDIEILKNFRAKI